jgi:hypothetical protein
MVTSKKIASVFAALTLATLLMSLGCSSVESEARQGVATAAVPAAVPTDVWSATLQEIPFPYLLPLPERERTALDGTYAKVELKDTPPVHCLRCPDYAPEGGVWKLQLDRGTFRIHHQVSGWQSVGSYIVTRDRWTAGAPDQLLLFNDPTCPDAIGLYAWRLEDGKLVLQVLDDTCAIYLRAKNLTGLPWLSCQPPNIEAGITDHWLKPPGCE